LALGIAHFTLEPSEIIGKMLAVLSERLCAVPLILLVILLGILLGLIGCTGGTLLQLAHAVGLGSLCGGDVIRLAAHGIEATGRLLPLGTGKQIGCLFETVGCLPCVGATLLLRRSTAHVVCSLAKLLQCLLHPLAIG
jgi:hypothetical protein